MYMWWLLLLFVVYFLWMKRREGMSPSVREKTLMQMGEIQKLEEQMASLNIKQELVDRLEKSVDQNVENTTALRSNMVQKNATRSEMAYPDSIAPVEAGVDVDAEGD
jgi:hypothetical protein